MYLRIQRFLKILDNSAFCLQNFSERLCFGTAKKQNE